MKLFYAIITVFFAYQVLPAQLSNPESITYSSYYDMYYISDAGSGKIYTSPDGKSDFQELTSGLSSPKGIFNEYDLFLWVTDVTEIKRISISTGEVESTIPIEDAQFLNDIFVDYMGNIYISDTQTGVIYKYYQFAENTEVLTDDIAAPNGIYYSDLNEKLYCVTFNDDGNIYEIDSEGNTEIVFNSSQTMLDGITFNNDYSKAYISSWNSNSVYEINLSEDDDFDFVFENEKLLQSGLNSPADIFFNTFKEELAIPLMNAGDIEIISFPPRPASPNDLEYYPENNSLYITNFETQKIIYTELTDNIEDFEYKEFKRFSSFATSMNLYEDYLFVSVQSELLRIDLKSGETDKEFKAHAFLDDFTILDENNIIGINEFNSMMIINLETNEEEYNDDVSYTRITSDDTHLYLLEEIETDMKLVRFTHDFSDSVSVDLPSLIYNRLEIFDGVLYLTYDDFNFEKAGIKTFDTETLSLIDDISTKEDGSFPYGITKINDEIYYTVPMLDKIKILNDESSVANSSFRDMHIYPNPAGETINTEFDNFSFKIINLNGKTVKSGTSINSHIDINDIEQGYYILIINNNDDENYIQKFIKK